MLEWPEDKEKNYQRQFNICWKLPACEKKKKEKTHKNVGKLAWETRKQQPTEERNTN